VVLPDPLIPITHTRRIGRIYANATLNRAGPVSDTAHGQDTSWLVGCDDSRRRLPHG
jgi:hypothetical protein